MIARVGNNPCPLRLRNEWLSPCAASTLPSVGLEICASCATRGTCIRTHLFPTPCREAAITSFGDHPNAWRWPTLTLSGLIRISQWPNLEVIHLKGYTFWETERGVPRELDGGLLGKCRDELGRDLVLREKREARNAFGEAVKAK